VSIINFSLHQQDVAFKAVPLKKLAPSPDHAANPRDPLCCSIFTLTAKFLNTHVNSLDFLIDTGLCVSFLPHSFSKNQHSTGALRAANGSSMPCYSLISSIISAITIKMDVHSHGNGTTDSWC